MAEENGDILVQVCLECGRELLFADEPPADDLKCDRCGNTVFRTFHASTVDDEVEQDFEETTSRDVRPDDAEGEVTPGDLSDLERL